MNRFVAVVEVDDTPTAAMLEEIVPRTIIVPAVVELIVATAAAPERTLPEIINVPMDEFDMVVNALTSLPKTLPVTVTMPVLAFSIAGPPILVGPITFPFTLRLPPPAKYIAPPDVVLNPAITEPETLMVPFEPCDIVLVVVPAMVANPPSMLPVIVNDAAFCVIIAQYVLPGETETFPMILAEFELEIIRVGK